VHRWDVFWADLEPHVGSEQAGDSRPVLVVSNDYANLNLPVVTVLPLTKLEGKSRKLGTFEVPLPRGTVANEYTSLALIHHIRSISKFRLLEAAGRLEDADIWDRIELALLLHLGIAFDE
jgi:mRNA-degrading endonuclease toxin of MazEF toxin-antitoxin module